MIKITNWDENKKSHFLFFCDILGINKQSMISLNVSNFKAAYSVTMNIFRKFLFSFKSFVKVELSYVFTIKMFSTAENCMEK